MTLTERWPWNQTTRPSASSSPRCMRVVAQGSLPSSPFGVAPKPAVCSQHWAHTQVKTMPGAHVGQGRGHGSLYTWGTGEHGVLGSGDERSRATARPVDQFRDKQVSTTVVALNGVAAPTNYQANLIMYCTGCGRVLRFAALCGSHCDWRDVCMGHEPAAPVWPEPHHRHADATHCASTAGQACVCCGLWRRPHRGADREWCSLLLGRWWPWPAGPWRL